MDVWIPPGARPPNGYCSICDCDLWGTVGEMQKHMVACAKREIDTIRAAAPSQRQKGGVFDPDNWDPEAEEHLRRVGERMLKEGRLEMLPSERIDT